MAVLSNTGTVTPIGTELTVAFITPPAPGPLDNISVYFVGGTGGGNGQLELALYTTVGGIQTRVAQAKVQGSNTSSIIAWQTIGAGAGQTELLDTGGTTYTVTVVDLSANVPSSPRSPVTVTIAGVDTFDTAVDQNAGAVLTVLPGRTGTLPVFNGYAQFMDVAIDQTNLPPVTVTVTADCGLADPVLPSVQAIVKSVQMTGRDLDIASVFRQLKLPVATRYFASFTNNSRNGVALAFTAVTFSTQVMASGAPIVLGGDATGPSNNNTVVGWEKVPLGPSFPAPPALAVPISAGANGMQCRLLVTLLLRHLEL